MSKKNCCCRFNPDNPDGTPFCCNPIFYKEFITLFGDDMGSHAEVNHKDWIALYVARPPATGKNTYWNTHLPSTSAPYQCNCQNLNDSTTCGNFQDCPGPDCYYQSETPEGAEQGRKACCQRFYLTTSAVGTAPIYFAYKYSGCHLLWFLREFAFNYDPYVTQCNGFITREQISEGVFSRRENSCHPFAQQQPVGAGTQASPPAQCTITSYDAEMPYLAQMPCACSTHPHIHGGVYDALYHRVNVRTTPLSLGYIPFMLPFSQPMLGSEAGCCWCAFIPGGAPWDAYKKQKRGCFMNSYPKSDGTGRTIQTSNLCGPGIDCANMQTTSIGLNPRYTTNCFARGISPYLMRIAQKDHRMAHAIWGHGQDPNIKTDFGVSYDIKEIQILDQQKDLKLKFKKHTGRKTSLKEQFIGTIHLEHHFEMYAYRSSVGSAVLELQALQNNCNALIAPYERYGGVVSRRGTHYRWTPWKYDSILWQVRRAVPRRVMYRGSGIPLFQFDLVNMENISYAENIDYLGNYFDGALFMENYFRYFYGLIYFSAGKCEGIGDVPSAPEWDFSHFLESYFYVRFWLEKMIEKGILKIKDHAIDIAKEVNDLIRVGRRNPVTNEIEIPENILLSVGGTTGYIQLLNLFNVEPGPQNANITPKIIKEKLLSTSFDNFSTLDSYIGPSGNTEPMRAFLPRRAMLPLSNSENGMTAWGVTGGRMTLAGTSFGVTGPQTTIAEAIRMPSFFEREDVKEIINPQKIVCGLMAAFIIDISGKIFPIGSDDLEPTVPCGGPFDTWQPTIGCYPRYLDIINLFRADPDAPPDRPRLIRQLQENIPDASVINLAFRKDFVVAQMDHLQNALAQSCFDPSAPPRDLYTPAYENSVGSFRDETLEKYGIGSNVNGNNEYWGVSSSGDFWICLPEDPFCVVNTGPGQRNGARGNERRKPNAFRLKSWGTNAKKYGTFCGSNYQAGEPGQCTPESIQSLRWDPEVNPKIDGWARMYPGTNTFFIWTEISSGIKHFAAIDDMNGIFITPLSDNTFNQSEKGKGVTYYSLYKQQLERAAAGDPFADPPNWICEGHNHLGKRFNYFPHLPRPGYVKEEEWTQSFYNNITLRDSAYKKWVAACPFDFTVCGSNNFPPTGGGGYGTPCAERIYKTDPNGPNGCCSAPLPVSWRDKTSVLMGNLVDYDYFDPDSPAGIYLPESPTQPKYTKVACGTYNTLLLTNENKLEIYGSYLKINSSGDPVIDSNNPLIPTFIPDEIQALKGSWDVEYACNKIHCQGATHSPILSCEYIPPSESNIIREIYSSSDYSICVTEDNRIHIWGDKSMIPGLFNPSTYRPGDTGYRVLTEVSNATEIVSVAAGINSIYIHYKKNLLENNEGLPIIASVTYEFTRYNINGAATEVPLELRNARITDIGAGYLHALAIYSKNLQSRTWKFSDFSSVSKPNQFKNFPSLPFYFRRQAFFHALPGTWDYSKWLYGSICCNSLESPGGGELETGSGNPVSRLDPCSILSYNIYNGQRDLNLSYSGNPQLFWMRSDWRRATFQASEVVPTAYFDPTDPLKCRPDIGINTDGRSSNFSYMSGALGDCLNNYGPVWGAARPLVSSVRRDQIRQVATCWTVPCQNNILFTNPSPNVAGPFTSLGVSPYPQTGYRTTRDLFQKMTHYYGNASNMSNDSTAFSVCPAYKGSAYSYFKYAERHSYFGYDRETDTWDIYDNPDFLRETSDKYQPLLGNTLVNWDKRNVFGGGICGCCSGYQIAPEGFTCTPNCRTTGFGGETTSGGTHGCCDIYLHPGCTVDWSILRTYPLTGPNYALENIVETPVVLSATEVIRVVGKAIAGTPDGNPNEEICNECFGGGFSLSNIQSYLGPGGFMMSGGSAGILYNGPGDGSMAYRHLYNQFLYRTEYPSQLLRGVRTNLRTITTPPNQPNTDYAKFSFSDVLRDPELTNRFTPWRYGNSSKWNPICWVAPTLLPKASTPLEIEKELYFNYSINQDPEGIFKQISTEPTSTPPQQPQPIEVTYDLFNLEIIEGPGTLPPGSDGYSREDPSNVRLMEQFITNPDYPRSVILQEGMFEFFVQAKSRWGTGIPAYFFVKLFKVDTSGNKTFLIESSRNDTVGNPPPRYDSLVDGGTTDNGGNYTHKYEELKFNLYVDEPILLEETDRLMVQFCITGGNADGNAERGEAIFIKYEDSSTILIDDDNDPITPPINTGVSRYTRMQFTYVDRNESTVCFSGIGPGDNVPTAYGTQIDPNIVLIIYDQNGNPTVDGDGSPIILGPAVNCNIAPCCGE